MAADALSLCLHPFQCIPSRLSIKPYRLLETRTSFSFPIINNNHIDRWFNPLDKQRRRFSQPQIVRPWVQSNSPKTHDPKERFTVVSYNVLADRNAMKHRDLYPNVQSEYMNWDYRKKLICKELIGLNPDIICLQEVDKYYELLRIMETKGYAGIYKRRTGDTVDGCAMFWKADAFRLLEGDSIEFKEFGLRDNVAQVSVFEMCKANSRRILVGNIHVLFNQNRGDIKLSQIRLLLLRAHALSEKWGDVPVVLGGDFNSTPQSAVYNFLSSSKLNITSCDRKDLSGQRSYQPAQYSGFKREKEVPFDSMDRLVDCLCTDKEVKTATSSSSSTMVDHPLKLSSSYATVKGSTRTRDSIGEPLATTYHSKFLGTVDYLWYSNNLYPTRVLDTLPIDVLRKTGGLPCKKLGSDHLALGSEFAFIQCKREDGHNTKGDTSIATMTATRPHTTEEEIGSISLLAEI